ncbi:hypothetical protein TNCV_527901 [Trichonephila clavipes]|nr:hypothetical protein TNCV_527901 [Trichonephila clavipes]
MQCRFIHWAPREPDKLDLTRFSGYKFRSSSTKGPVDLLHPGPQNELQSTLLTCGKVVSDADCCVVGPGRRAASPLVWLVEGEERWKAPNHPQRVIRQNWGGTERNRIVTCMVLKATDNDKRTI